MANNALERARQITEQARQKFEGDQALLAEQAAKAAREVAGEGSDEQDQTVGDAGQTDTAQNANTNAHQDKPEEAYESTETAPEDGARIRELEKQIEALQRNYDNLRSYADRTQTDNTALKRENQELNSQIQYLLADRQRGGNQAPQGQSQAQPREGAVPQQHTGESNQDYLARLLEHHADLREANEDFPHLIQPLLKVVDDLRREMNSRVDPIHRSMQEEIRLSQEQRQLSAEESQREETRKYFAAIADKHPDYKPVMEGEAFAAFLNNHRMRDTYVSLLWPYEGERLATAREVIAILDEFKESQETPANRSHQSREEQASQRRQAAEADAEPSLRSTRSQGQGAPSEGEYIKRSDIIAWSKDPNLFRQKRGLINEARLQGRIIEDVAR
jgi:regulator of replication initiation timing